MTRDWWRSSEYDTVLKVFAGDAFLRLVLFCATDVWAEKERKDSSEGVFFFFLIQAKMERS